MAPFAQPFCAELDDLLHHAEDRIADALGLQLETGEIDVLDAGLLLDLARRLFGNDAEPRLHARQGALDVEVVADPGFVGENAAHFLRAENVAEDRGVERSCGHGSLQRGEWRIANRVARCSRLATSYSLLAIR